MPSTYNITAATLIKAGSGKLKRYSILVAGAAGTINDAASTGTAAAANAMFVLPAVVGTVDLGTGWVFGSGLVVSPGAGQTVSVDWE